MSGELIALTHDADGHMAALVRAAATVATHAGVPVAVIGGLAVMCRLSTTHRATADVDFVSEDPEEVSVVGSPMQNLLAAKVVDDHPVPQPGRVFVRGTKVEIIETAPLSAQAASGIEPDSDRLFVLAHRWALETATPCTVMVTGSDAQATVPVATVAALIAMKLNAFRVRTDERKRASDAWDVYRLLHVHGSRPELAAVFSTAPDGLCDLVRDAITHAFRIDVLRTRQRVQAYGDPAWGDVMTEEALQDLAEELSATLS